MRCWYGVVENREDPLKLGRVQVRVVGKHDADKLVLPTEKLPWALVIQPTTSAAMNGIGYAPVGMVPGTWVIVDFMDEDSQQPIVLGSIGGIPGKNSVVSDEEEGAIVIRDPESGIAEEQIVSTNARGDQIKTISDPIEEPAKATRYDGKPNTDLPTTTPPPNSVTNTGLASAGIQAIIVACKEAGYTDKNAVSAILGIVGGESLWIPQTENLNYTSSVRLQDVFRVFRDNPSLAEQYVNNPKELAEFVYGWKSSNARVLGNLAEGDGYKYIGRGFIQLTGKANYEKYGELAGVDCLGNPDILVNDRTASAKVTAAYFKDRLKNVSISQNDPRFFEAALKSVGNNTADVRDRKRRYYEYFLGAENGYISKDSSYEDRRLRFTPDGKTINLPGGDRSSNVTLGFSDPEGKYPLRDYLYEPDTNRLARGQFTGTCVELKDAQRTHRVPTAFGGKFEQPIPPYAAVYPFNKVFESESGHVMEFDDTPKNERVNILHRSGTFTEVDANGTQVNKIIGDGYAIFERNGYVYVAGECNLTVDGTVNILCNADANIEVMGNVNADFRADANVGVYGNVNLGVGGNVNARVEGDVSAKVVGDVLLDVTGNMSSKVKGTYDICCESAFRVTAASISMISTGESAYQGSFIYLNTAGKAQAAICTPAPQTLLDTHIPDRGEVVGASFKPLEAPPRGHGQTIEDGEVPEDFDAEASAKVNAGIAGTKSTSSNTTSAESTLPQPTTAVGGPAYCEAIYSTEIFQNSYVLSEKSNITIGTLLAVPGNCSTPQDTVVSDSKNGPLYRMSKQEVVCNMKQVAMYILEGVYSVIDRNRIIVTSSFRMPGIARSSNRSSDHNKGRAIDIQLVGKPYSAKDHYDLVCALQKVLPYDQLILEYRDANRTDKPGARKVWIHISYRGDSNRKQAFTMLNDSKYRVNGQQQDGFHLI